MLAADLAMMEGSHCEWVVQATPRRNFAAQDICYEGQTHATMCTGVLEGSTSLRSWHAKGSTRPWFLDVFKAFCVLNAKSLRASHPALQGRSPGPMGYNA